MKIKNKLASFSIIITFICFLLTTGFIFYHFSKTVQDNVAITNKAQLAAVAESMKFIFGNIEQEVESLANETVIHRILSQYDMLPLEQRNQNVLVADERLNDFILRFDQEVDFVEIIPKNSRSDLKISTYLEPPQKYDYKIFDMILHDHASTWLQSNKNSELLPKFNADKTLLIQRVIQENVELGVIIVHLRQTVWDELFSELDIALLILSEDQHIIYKSNRIAIEEDHFANRRFSAKEQSYTETINHEQYNIDIIMSQFRNWSVVSLTNSKSIFKDMRTILNIIISVGFFCFVVSLIFSVIVAYRFATPLYKMGREITDMVRRGQFALNREIRVPHSILNRGWGSTFNIIIVYLAIIVVPLCIFSVTMISVSSQNIKTQLEKYHMNNLKLVGKYIDLNVTNYNKYAQYLFGHAKLNEWMIKRIKDEIGHKEFADRMNNLLDHVYNNSLRGIGVTLLDNDKQVIYSSSCRQNQMAPQLEVILHNTRNATVWFPPTSECGTKIINFGKRMVSFQNSRHFYFYEQIGYIIFTINETVLEQVYRSFPQLYIDQLFLVDKNGSIISDAKKERIGTKVDNNILRQIRSADLNVGYLGGAKQETDIIFFRNQPKDEWMIINLLPQDLLVKTRNTMAQVVIAVIISNILLISLCFYGFIRRLKRRIDNISMAMNEITGGNLHVELPIRKRDEIESLAIGFNGMVMNLKKLMEENYNQGIRRKAAELNALQSQINPHFLYNTLDSINWEAMLMTNGPNKVSDMVTALADLLKLSINTGNEIVTLEDEMNHIKCYLIIQRERYSDRFDLSWDVDPRLYGYRILKLILQPLVENAIYHGLELKEGPGMITISAVIAGDNVQIEIKDDGIGMDEDQLRQVIHSLKSETPIEGRGIGIYNVKERIQLYYGKSYGIKVFSETGVGTRIVLELPLFHEDPNVTNRS